MQANLKFWKGFQLWTFKEEGKVVGYLGIKIPYNIWKELGVEKLT